MINMNVDDLRYLCPNCSYVGYESEWETRCVFYGNLEEPPEYVGLCPNCGRDMADAVELADPEEEYEDD